MNYALILLIATVAGPALAADTGGAATTPAGGDGSSQGAAPKGFDVSGSHPLPNGGEAEPPGRGACGCRLALDTHGADPATCLAVLAVALARLRRRTVA